MKKKTLKKSKPKSKSSQKSKAVKKSTKFSKPNKSFVSKLKASIETIASEVVGQVTKQPTGLISAIKQDHDGLRQFIDALKDTKREMAERRRAYELFSALLKSHTTAEEKAVYKTIVKGADAELTIRIEEGFVEHQVASDVMARMEKTSDPTIWSAHANVLAELVDHHLDEEEEKMFPLVRQQINKKNEADLIVMYLDLRASTQKKVTPKNAGILSSLLS